MILTWWSWLTDIMKMSFRYVSSLLATMRLKMSFISFWNVAAEFVSPKTITVGSNSPLFVTKAAFRSSLMQTLLYP